jgi:hypothetical protein
VAQRDLGITHVMDYSGSSAEADLTGTEELGIGVFVVGAAMPGLDRAGYGFGLLLSLPHVLVDRIDRRSDRRGESAGWIHGWGNWRCTARNRRLLL